MNLSTSPTPTYGNGRKEPSDFHLKRTFRRRTPIYEEEGVRGFAEGQLIDKVSEEEGETDLTTTSRPFGPSRDESSTGTGHSVPPTPGRPVDEEKWVKG